MSRAPNVKRPPRMPAAELVISSAERAEHGCIVTAREQASGRRYVLHRSGRGAFELIVGFLDALDGDWRVLSYSTPGTIYRDLQGTREHEWRDTLQCPETQVLGRLGRLDLLDPALAPRLQRGRTHG